MSRSAGAGRPLTLRCTKCKVCRDVFDNKGTNLEATGRIRFRKPSGNGCQRVMLGGKQAEFHCRDCGHVGWSRHTDMKKLLRKIGKDMDDV